MKFLTGPIKRAWKLLAEPRPAFKEMQKRPFEKVVSDYLILLVAVAIVAGLTALVFGVLKAVYYDIFFTIDIQYLRMVNYAMGRTTSLGFFFIFAGTFLLFFLSLVLKPFFRKIKFTQFLGVLFYSMSPVLLFGWIPVMPYALFIWALFLFIIGVSELKASGAVRKDSIQQRD